MGEVIDFPTKPKTEADALFSSHARTIPVAKDLPKRGKPRIIGQNEIYRALDEIRRIQPPKT
jgi:hypothetical protein